MSKILTDEVIERAAKAAWEATHPNPPGWAAWNDRDGFGPSDTERKFTVAQIRAALLAIMPDIGEAFAKIADQYAKDCGPSYGEGYPAVEAGNIADAIRAAAKGE